MKFIFDREKQEVIPKPEKKPKMVEILPSPPPMTEDWTHRILKNEE